MTVLQKVRYVFLSILYGLFAAILFTPFTIELQRITGSDVSQKFGNPYLGNSSIVFIFMVLLLQLVRVILSNRRAEEAQPELMAVSFWTWHTNLQFYFIAIGLGSLFLYFMLGRL